MDLPVRFDAAWWGSLKKSGLTDSAIANDSRLAGARHDWAQGVGLFITGALRQLIPDDHVLVRVDRVLDLSLLRDGSLIAIVATMVGRASILRWRSV